MVSLHPPLSGLPLAAALALLLCEALRAFSKLRGRMDVYRPALVVGVVCAASLSFLSGYQASSELGAISGEVERELGRHHSLGRFYLISALALGAFYLVRSRARHGRILLTSLYYAALLSVLLLTFWVGALGGDLVFEHGLGVKNGIVGPS